MTGGAKVMACGLLRAHVGRGAADPSVHSHDGIGLRSTFPIPPLPLWGSVVSFSELEELFTFFKLLGQPEVGDVRLTVGIEKDITRLQVPMNDQALMGMVDGLRDLGHQLCRPALVPPSRSLVDGATPQALCQATALDQLHHVVMLPLMLPH